MMNIQDILHILVCSLISDMYRIIDAKDCTYNYYCQLFTPVFWFLLWVFNNHADVSMLHNFIYYSRKYCISSANQSHWYPTIIVDHAHIIEVLFFIIHNAVCIFPHPFIFLSTHLTVQASFFISFNRHGVPVSRPGVALHPGRRLQSGEVTAPEGGHVQAHRMHQIRSAWKVAPLNVSVVSWP